MMEWRAVWRGVRSAEKQLSALLESGVPTAAKELTTHNSFASACSAVREHHNGDRDEPSGGHVPALSRTHQRPGTAR